MITTFQFSSFTDHLTDDGAELTKKPYPIHANESGVILNRSPSFVIGFVRDLARMEVDVYWDDADVEQMVGWYVITMDQNGQYATELNAIESITIKENS